MERVREQIERYLNGIGELFKNPKITLVVRAPQLDDGDVVMTNDDLTEAIRAIEKSRAAEAAEGRGTGGDGR